jgi:hypothetical protein
VTDLDPHERELAGNFEDRRRHDEKLTAVVADLEKTAERLEAGRKANRGAISWLVRGFVILAAGNAIVGYAVIDVGKKASTRNSERIADIQAQRKDSILSSCRDQNGRHDNTIRKLDKGLAAATKAHPERAVQARESRSFTVTLIEALAPKQNCEQRARELVPK